MFLGASLAYYTVFSLVPFLFLVVLLAGLIVRPETVQARVMEEIANVVGPDVAQVITSALRRLTIERGSVTSLFLSGGLLVWGSMGVTNRMRESLITLWAQPSEYTPSWRTRYWWRKRLRAYGISFIIVFFSGVTVGSLLLFSTTLEVFQKSLVDDWPLLWVGLRWASVGLSYVSIAFVFAGLYRILPERRPSWGSILAGASVATVLFFFGQEFLGWYLMRSRLLSFYGAGQAIAVLLLWSYYFAQIFLLGASVTRAVSLDKTSSL